ncbi:MAG: ribonuclease H-like domain-containing protein [Proteobacteria bacterium]|nr:ribonuclease H-like domain-containing protein [Pseudomonadota bacterium]
MLQHTFSHIPGIGRKIETKLWEAGITTWDKWRNPPPIRLSAITRVDAMLTLKSSTTALEDDPSFFTKRLDSSEVWRIFPHFRARTAYLDIETTGLDDSAEITTISLYDGRQVFTYVNGINLHDFVDAIHRYQVIVSYNGKSFDVPVLERFFRIKLNHAQIDLRYVLARLGFKGGLKGCEKKLGMNRGSLDGVDGYFAVLLWQRYRDYNDEKALHTLLAYNIEDTVNLERLAIEAYNRNVMGSPFSEHLFLPFPTPPAMPFHADYDCIERVRRSLSSW